MKSGRMLSNIELMFVTKSFFFEVGFVIMYRKMWDSEYVLIKNNKGLVKLGFYRGWVLLI